MVIALKWCWVETWQSEEHLWSLNCFNPPFFQSKRFKCRGNNTQFQLIRPLNFKMKAKEVFETTYVGLAVAALAFGGYRYVDVYPPSIIMTCLCASAYSSWMGRRKRCFFWDRYIYCLYLPFTWTWQVYWWCKTDRFTRIDAWNPRRPNLQQVSVPLRQHLTRIMIK